MTIEKEIVQIEGSVQLNETETKGIVRVRFSYWIPKNLCKEKKNMELWILINRLLYFYEHLGRTLNILQVARLTRP